ncbi:hypothetical protein AB0H71_28810 [Nocardia sp. NPDC050697]|uniref:hypothetical protein n=1 Tax=Nocardia sp. NPDC050697 TaxID=3155158 RepID=UPI0033F49762
MNQAAEDAWREAVRSAQALVDGLSADLNRFTATMDSVESRAGMLTDSTVPVDSSHEQQVVRGHQLIDVTQRGVDEITRAIIDATNRADDLRRALDFYHH